MKPKIQWKRLSATAITPRKGYIGDVAYDLFADHNSLVGSRATLIQTNIAAAIPEGYGGLLMGRSKLATKSITPLAFVLQDEIGRLRLGGCIDPSYRGPIGFIVASIGGLGTDRVEAGDAVAQMWILPIPDMEDEDVGNGELPPGIRGGRGYGSTDPVRPPIVQGGADWLMSRAEMEGRRPTSVFIPSISAGPTVPGYAGVASRLVEEHNRHRNREGLPAMYVSRELTATAQLHADDMARRRRMSHVGKNGSTVAARISYQGYRWRRAGENIAAGYRDVESVMKGWMGSTGHRMNILGDFRDIGVGHAVASDGTPYWCVVFATAASVRAGREGELFQADDAISTPGGIYPWNVGATPPGPVNAWPWDMGFPPGSVGLEMKAARGRHEQIREDELGEYLRDVLDKFQNGSPIIMAPGARLEQLTDFRERVSTACGEAARECWTAQLVTNPELSPAEYDAAMIEAMAGVIRRHVLEALDIPKLGVVEDEAPDPGTPPDLAPDVVKADSGVHPDITEQVDGDQP